MNIPIVQGFIEVFVGMYKVIITTEFQHDLGAFLAFVVMLIGLPVLIVLIISRMDRQVRKRGGLG